MLETYGFVEVEWAGPQSVLVSITSDGSEVADDPAALRRDLPKTAAEDEDSHLAVAPDALKELILSCEQMLARRGWTSAEDEMKAAARAFEEHDWTTTVRELYSALESGLKHALRDSGEPYRENLALNKLAGQAARAGLIPANYQSTFGFADSIRSPRSHGAGPDPTPVPIGEPEALLMMQLTQALLLYLGSRAPLPVS